MKFHDNSGYFLMFRDTSFKNARFPALWTMDARHRLLYSEPTRYTNMIEKEKGYFFNTF